MKMLDAALRERAWVDVDLGALVANARMLAAKAQARLLPMVKANGYGVGAVAVARALESVGPWGFGVATPAEGAELRAAGITLPIVVFTPLQSGWIDSCLRHSLTPSIGDAATLAQWIAADRPFHLEIDTGMGRSGVRWSDEAELRAVHELLGRAAHWEGVFTHFHSAESDLLATHEQWRRFQSVLDGLPPRPRFVHACNSAAILRCPQFAADLVRPGIFLYGGDAGDASPHAVVRLHAQVVATRRVARGDGISYGATWRASEETTVATLAIGYGDGLPRSLSNHGFIELAGVRCPITGRVTMDMTMVETGALPVAQGDIATVFGGIVTVDEQARAASTIAYELLTGLGRRLPRRYDRGA
jgi:alanine racemase